MYLAFIEKVSRSCRRKVSKKVVVMSEAVKGLAKWTDWEKLRTANYHSYYRVLTGCHLQCTVPYRSTTCHGMCADLHMQQLQCRWLADEDPAYDGPDDPCKSFNLF